MKMKISMLVALCAAGGGTEAYAQTNVSVYGLIDATIRRVDNVNAKGDALVGFQTPWFSGSRIGFRGVEDLGGGLRTQFKLEAEYVIGTGAMDTAGVIFNRDAWVSLDSDDLGTLRLGRQNTVARDFAQVYGDAYGSSQLSYDEGGFTNTNNFKQVIFYVGSATGTRTDNGIQWKKVFSNGLVAAVGHQLGEVAGNVRKNTTDSIAFGYNGKNWVAATAYTRANVNDLINQSWTVGGSYIMPFLRLNAGYFNYKANQAGTLGSRKDNVWTLSTKLTPGGVFDYEVGYVNFKAKNAAFNGDATGILNPFSDTSKATSTGTGSKSTVYGSAFYHLSKRTELYLAADYMKLKDEYRVASAAGQNKQTEFAIGMRTRF